MCTYMQIYTRCSYTKLRKIIVKINLFEMLKVFNSFKLKILFEYKQFLNFKLE